MAKLMDRFCCRKANAVLTMQLQRLSGLEVEKINEELLQRQAEIAEYRKILANEGLIYDIIVSEMTEIKEKYGTPRKSEVSYDYSEINIADLIDKEDIVVTMTHSGYIKRQPVAEYRSQRRGGMGITAHKAKEEDFVEYMLTTSTHDDLLFFTSKGKVFAVKGYEIPEAQRTARGRAMVNLLQLAPEEKVTAILPLAENPQGYLMLATKNGLIKKTPLKEFESIKRNSKSNYLCRRRRADFRGYNRRQRRTDYGGDKRAFHPLFGNPCPSDQPQRAGRAEHEAAKGRKSCRYGGRVRGERNLYDNRKRLRQALLA